MTSVKIRGTKYDGYLEQCNNYFNSLVENNMVKGQVYAIGDNVSPRALELIDTILEMDNEEFEKTFGHLACTNLDSKDTYNFLDGLRIATRILKQGKDLKDLLKSYLSGFVKPDYDNTKTEFVEDTTSWSTDLTICGKVRNEYADLFYGRKKDNEQ